MDKKTRSKLATKVIDFRIANTRTQIGLQQKSHRVTILFFLQSKLTKLGNSKRHSQNPQSHNLTDDKTRKKVTKLCHQSKN